MYFKYCPRCNEHKNSAKFFKNKSKRDGLSSYCKTCHKNDVKERRPKYKEQERKHWKRWHQENKNERKEYQRKWKSNNVEHVRAYQRNYCRDKLEHDIEFRICLNIRNRTRKALNSKSSLNKTTADLIGCTQEELKEHLESQFEEGMTWDNYGEWHIDHIRPLSSFNLLDAVELRQASNFSNLQPMWAADNIRKGNKLAGASWQVKQ